MKQGGMFSDVEILSREFSPRDVFQLKIYRNDPDNFLPKECLENDQFLPYCQIIGDY